MASAKKAAKKAAQKNPKPPSKPLPGPFAGKWLWVAQAAVLIALTLIVYLPSFKVPFHFDDLESIINDRYIRMTELNAHTMFEAAFQDFKQNRPLSNLSFALNFYFNLMNPFGYHLVNFLILVFTALGVWLFLKKLFSRLKFDPRRAGLAAWLAALVWVVHPVNVQAVTYIVQRHASLAGGFSIWSIYFYHLARERKNLRPLFYVLCALFCILAMLSKESAALLPAIIFIYGLYFFDGLSQGWLKRNWKWILGLSIFYLLAALMVLRPGMLQKLSLDFKSTWFTPWQKFLTGPRTMVWYFFLTLFPIPQSLSVVHDYPVSKSLFHPWTTAASSLVVCAMIVAAIYKARRWKIFSFCAAWFFGNLLIESMPLPIDLVNEHRLYLASLAIIVPVAAWPVFKAKNVRLAAFLILMVAAFFGFFSYSRNIVWLSRVSLWRDAVMKAPDNNRPWHNYCSFLIKEEDVKRAGFACKYALILNEKQAETHSNMGSYYFKIQMNDQAEKEYLRAIEIDPKFPPAYFNLGLVKASQKDIIKAEEYFDKSMELGSNDAQVYLNLGNVYDRLGKPEKSYQAYVMALQARPEWSEARFKVASILAGKGMCPDAVSLLRAAPAQDRQFKQVFDYCRSH